MVIILFIFAALIIESAVLFFINPDSFLKIREFFEKPQNIRGQKFLIDDFFIKHRYIAGIFLVGVGITILVEGVRMSTTKADLETFSQLAASAPYRQSVVTAEESAEPARYSSQQKAEQLSTEEQRVQSQLIKARVKYVDEVLEGGIISKSLASEQSPSPDQQGHTLPDRAEETSAVAAPPTGEALIEDKALLRMLRQQAKEREAKEAMEKKQEESAAQQGETTDTKAVIEDKELLKYLEAVK
ncbi:MAG: hypothetical protein JW844_00225 [Candidatus Omnitrophica bacterium]|nr:hypothetical protein [Candidatus Omnitrophota bacterium]